MKTYKFIGDQTELRWYWDFCVPPLNNNSVYFISLSARNKYLNEKEREIYKLGKSEMFAKTIIRKDDWNIFLENISRFECNINGYITKAGVPYLQKSLLCYININPSDVLKTVQLQAEKINELQNELCNAALKKHQPAIDEAYHKLRKVTDSELSLYARTSSEKYWIDFDCDIEQYQRLDYRTKDDFLNDLYHFLSTKVGIGNFVLVETVGGIHILVRKEAIKFNPVEISAEILRIGLEDELNIKECIYNTNSMIPTPGTIQNETHVVRILNKKDFKEEHKMKHPII